jgi:hypothetical protein
MSELRCFISMSLDGFGAGPTRVPRTRSASEACASTNGSFRWPHGATITEAEPLISVPASETNSRRSGRERREQLSLCAVNPPVEPLESDSAGRAQPDDVPAPILRVSHAGDEPVPLELTKDRVQVAAVDR